MSEPTLTNGNSVNVEKGVTDFVEVKVPVPWGHIAGKWWGSQEIQPIIALHGWLDNAGTFDNLAPLLIKNSGRSILCIDLPGHGLSSHFPKGSYYYLCWDGVMIIRRLQKYYKWTEPLSLLGHSLGGAICFLYAAVYNDEVKEYISIDIASPAVKAIETISTKLGKALDEYLKIETLLDAEQRSANYTKCIDTVQMAHNGSCTRESCEILMRRGMKLLENTDDDKEEYTFCRDLRLKIPILGFVSIDDVRIYAAQIKCRILNIRAVGTDVKTEISKEYYDKVVEMLKQSASVFEYVEVVGTHHLHLNDAHSVSDFMIKFLNN